MTTQTRIAPVTTQWVYAFGAGRADGGAHMRNLLGGKGANLAEMSALGLPVPPGFTITTEACNHYYANDKNYPDGLEQQVTAGLAKVEELTGKRFGDAASPLLVSVRSGARASMPGMETRAPERTLTSSGRDGSPSVPRASSPIWRRTAATCSFNSGG